MFGARAAATATVMMVVPVSTAAFCLGLQVVIDHMSKVPAQKHVPFHQLALEHSRLGHVQAIRT